jgi:hypothetical protein
MTSLIIYDGSFTGAVHSSQSFDLQLRGAAIYTTEQFVGCRSDRKDQRYHRIQCRGPLGLPSAGARKPFHRLLVARYSHAGSLPLK